METNKDWEKVTLIYDEAIKLDESKQKDFVSKQCEGQRSILEQVMKMLEAKNSQDFMAKYPGKINAENIDVSIPQQLGHFKILKKIATGGMGRVYLGQSTTADVQIKVALKTIRIELISKELRSKFQNEKNILSQLKHKNIASLIDAGISDNQIPYIATEWVDGENIKDYCIKHNLSVKKRLRLFLQVCDAMIFAHNKLIIHRDLKPENILVNNHKQVKLLDFGIAKIVDENQNDQTQTQTQIFTPDYAAPEQLSGEICTAATDIYSLGIILFEILTNSKRFNLSGLAIAEKIKAIAIPKQADLSDVQPDKPLPYSLSHLKGPLYNIINKAMHVDSNRRYDSVASLVSDIENYLDNRPVKAMKDSIFYKTKMLIIRNKLASGFLVLAFIGISTGLLISNKQLNLKEREARKSKTMFNFLNQILVSASPNQGGSTNITVKEMFETGVSKYDIQSISDPYIKAELSAKIGLIFGQMGDYDKELKYIKETVHYYQTHLDSESNNNSFLKYSIQMVGAYTDHHDYDKALEYIQKALKITSSYNVDTKLLCQANILLARIYHGKQNFIKTKEYLNKANSLLSKSNNYLELGEVNYYFYALLYEDLSIQEQLQYLEKAEINFEKSLDTKFNPNLLAVLSARADMLSITGDLKGSELLHKKVSKLTIETFGNDDFLGLISRAKNLNKIGKFKQSLELLNEAQRVYESNNMNRVPAYHGYLSYLATVYVEFQRFNEAESLYLQVRDYFSGILPGNHVILKIITNNLADLYLKSKNIEKLNIETKKLISYVDENSFNDSISADIRVLILTNLGNIHLNNNNILEAKKYYSLANSIIVTPDKYNQGHIYWQLQTGLELTNLIIGDSKSTEQYNFAKKQLLNLVLQNSWYKNFYRLQK